VKTSCARSTPPDRRSPPSSPTVTLFQRRHIRWLRRTDSCRRMTSRTTKVRNSSAKSGSSLLTAARYRRRLTCSASLPGTHGAVRAGPSICRPRGYIGTALQKPDGGSAHRRYILVEAEEIGWIVLGLEFNQPCIIASERCPYRVWLFIADEIQQVAVA